MKLRILTALALIPPVLYLILWSPQWLFTAALLAVVFRTVFEYFELSRAAGLGGFRRLGYAGCAGFCLAQWADLRWSGGSGLTGAIFVLLASLTIPLALTVVLVRTREMRQYIGEASCTVFGIFYVGLPLSWLLPLRFPRAELAAAAESVMPPGEILLFLFLVNWAGDIFAYFVGRGLGRVRLFPHISPNKTLE